MLEYYANNRHSSENLLERMWQKLNSLNYNIIALFFLSFLFSFPSLSFISFTHNTIQCITFQQYKGLHVFVNV
jgi:hypothetical protein